MPIFQKSDLISKRKNKLICHDVFRDYSQVDDKTDSDNFDCGILAHLFPKDIFYELVDEDSKTYPISLENVADKGMLKLFETRGINPELQNPLFINWMVDLLEK